ncbi:MAG: glutamine-hydrolyzing GMP synthase [Candidatus Undinarchaeales archaeon]
MVKPKDFIKNQIAEIKEEIPEGKAIIAVSGGVDSTTAAFLCSKAIGDRLTAIHVDTGLMRKNESKKVIEALKSAGVNATLVEAQDEFFKAMKGVTDPEEKRKIIGELFIDIFEKEAEKIEDAEVLIQGTIAPDWIESGTGYSGQTDTIKSHHNVGGLPEEMNLKLVEPLRELYKDEVREVASELSVPKDLYEKQPFPGPGLAVRILGEVTEEKVKVLQEADYITRNEIEKSAEKGEIELPWQYFAALLPVKSVGVQGDLRAYGNTIAVRAVQSADGMTANFSKFPPELLERISNKINNKLKDEINRVVYDITNKPPGTIEWE